MQNKVRIFVGQGTNYNVYGRHSKVKCQSIFFYTQFENCYKDELPKTLLTTHITTALRRYSGEHDILTTTTPFHKKQRTKLKLNIRLQKATYNNKPITTDRKKLYLSICQGPLSLSVNLSLSICQTLSVNLSVKGQPRFEYFVL